MQTSILVPCRLFFPHILSCTKLAEVLGSFGANILKQLESYSSYLLFVGVQVEEDNRVVLTS
jgi:hypothetical protein